MMALVFAGVLNRGFGLFHLAFWRLFGWPARLKASGAVNSAITQTLNCMLIYVAAAYGSLLIWLAVSGAAVSPFAAGAGAGFWAPRLILQPWLFPMRNWQSIAITAVFALAVLLHAVAAMPIRD